jgi:hypothetical protein
MNSTIRLTSAAIAVAATAALVLAVIALVTTGEDEKTRTIKLLGISDRRTEATADLGEKGESATDLSTLSNEVRENGKPVGRMFGSCTLAGTEQEGRGVCSLTIELKEGKLSADGTIDFRRENQPQDLSIAGGTGEFDKATGTLTIGLTPKKIPLTISVTTPDRG